MKDRAPLNQLLEHMRATEGDIEPVVPFAALYMEGPKIVTAVLERTAILAEPSDKYDRITVRQEMVFVDPETLEWRGRTSEYDGTKLLNKLAPAESGKFQHLHRRPSNSRFQRAGRITTPAPAAREASDERARKNQAEIEASKQRELAALRQRRSEKPADFIDRKVTSEEEKEVMSTMVEERTKVCLSCKKEKPESEFPRGLLRAGRVCASCKDLKGYSKPLNEVAEVRQSLDGALGGFITQNQEPILERAVEKAIANGDPETAAAVMEQLAEVRQAKPKRKYTRRAKAAKKPREAGRPRKAKVVLAAASKQIDEHAVAVTPALLMGDDVTQNDRHARIAVLLKKQDAARLELHRISNEILELVAAG